VAIFLAGVAAGTLTLSRRERGGMDPAAADQLKRSLADLESRLAAQETANAIVHKRIEARLDGHAAKLAEVPSVAQLTAAVEQLLTRTMSSLDERLTTQAHSIEVLRTTVSQTDSLLERVLESLDALQTHTDPAGLSSDASSQQPTV
jgi:glutamyl-tRNA reductase